MQLPDKEWPYVYYTSYDWPEVCDWCNKNIGEFDRDWYKLGEDITAQSIDPDYQSTYLFRNEQHAMLFLLRWQQ